MLKNSFLKLKLFITTVKVYIQRSTSYVSLFNSGMILFLSLSKLQDYGLNINLSKLMIPLFFLSIFLMVFIGFLEFKLGFFKEEWRMTQKQNPYMQEILSEIKLLREDLKK